MSFRTRLVLFFVVIVVVPMLAVAVMLFGLIGQSENGKSDAAIAARHDVAQQLLREQRDLARVAVAGKIASDRVLRSSLANGDRRRAAKRARQLVEFRGIERIVLARDGRTILEAGDKTAIAPAITRIESSTRRSLGRIEVSVIDALRYARRVRQITGLHTVVHDGRTLLGSTLPVRVTRELPRDGAKITVAGREYAVVSFGDRRPFTGQILRVSTLGAIEGTDDRIREGRITAGLILLGFFVLAIGCAVLLSIENVQLHETVAHESLTDALTGLPNRRAFRDALTSEVERSKRYGTVAGLVLLDIDDFKAINDTGGHQQGDVVLREVARVLRETSREVDHPARRDGDELTVVVPGTDLDGTFNFAERLRERIAALRIPRLDGQGEITVTTSCGVAAVPPIAPDEAALEAAADRALYQAKETGKNKTVRCDDERSD
ncbi:MAG TPA: GGDEF domain-containing protein [Solirubrobacteraceae bacterium]|nr:GGDEF domain-containing protein [Solirubrobacteraceae bacterium]